jgi:hypothetical protein
MADMERPVKFKFNLMGPIGNVGAIPAAFTATEFSDQNMNAYHRLYAGGTAGTATQVVNQVQLPAIPAFNFLLQFYTDRYMDERNSKQRIDTKGIEVQNPAPGSSWTLLFPANPPNNDINWIAVPLNAESKVYLMQFLFAVQNNNVSVDLPASAVTITIDLTLLTSR